MLKSPQRHLISLRGESIALTSNSPHLLLTSAFWPRCSSLNKPDMFSIHSLASTVPFAWNILLQIFGCLASCLFPLRCDHLPYNCISSPSLTMTLTDFPHSAVLSKPPKLYIYLFPCLPCKLQASWQLTFCFCSFTEFSPAPGTVPDTRLVVNRYLFNE